MIEDKIDKYLAEATKGTRLYHATLLENEDMILEKGLIPNQKRNWVNWSEKGYIYLAKTPDIALQWIKDLWTEQLEETGDIETFDDIVVFEVTVDPKEVTHDVGSNYKFKGNIEPDKIKVYKRYNARFDGDKFKISK